MAENSPYLVTLIEQLQSSCNWSIEQFNKQLIDTW
jgi:hypothetical protein